MGLWEGAEVGRERWEEQTVGALQRARRRWQLAEGKDKHGENTIPVQLTFGLKLGARTEK